MLNGRTALIVESEFIIALDFQRMLEGLDVGEILFARNPQEARQLRGSWADLAIAVIDLGINEPEIIELASELLSDGIAVVVTTAEHSQRKGLSAFPGLPVLVKPVPEEEMASAVERALAINA